jgi:mono/diheme cytochrome c family protein
MNRIAVFISVAAAFLSTAVLAQSAPPNRAAQEGERVARTTCAFCHVVADDQAVPPLLNQPTPSFREIADKPDSTARSLRRFITTTHWDDHTLPMTMPDVQLLDEEYGQVVAYILSLRTRTAPMAPEPKPTAQGRRLEAGTELALRQCSLCHVVTTDPRYRPSLVQPTPSFEAIANDPKTSAQSLRRFISTTHWDIKTIPMTMPDQMLSSEDIQSVINYILSLRKKG